MEERFDIYDESWEHAGTALRRDVHRLGLRHRSFHCWLYRVGEGVPKVLFQKRQQGKDTYPGYLDISAAGHLAAGETVRDAVRELEEELGIAAAFEELTLLGMNEERSVGTARGEAFIDHEQSEEYALRFERPLLSLRLQPEEVLGIYEAPLPDMIRLFDGELDELEAEGAELAGGAGRAGSAEGSGAGRAGGAEGGGAGRAGGAEGGGAGNSLAQARLIVRAEQFVPRPNGYYAGLFRRLLKLAEASGGA